MNRQLILPFVFLSAACATPVQSTGGSANGGSGQSSGGSSGSSASSGAAGLLGGGGLFGGGGDSGGSGDTSGSSGSGTSGDGAGGDAGSGDAAGTDGGLGGDSSGGSANTGGVNAGGIGGVVTGGNGGAGAGGGGTSGAGAASGAGGAGAGGGGAGGAGAGGAGAGGAGAGGAGAGGAGAGGAGAGGAGAGGAGAGGAGAGGAGAGGAGAGGLAGAGGGGGNGCAVNPVFKTQFWTAAGPTSTPTGDFRIFNNSGVDVSYGAIEIRYYLANEETATLAPVFVTFNHFRPGGFAAGNFANVAGAYVALVPAATGADTYLRITVAAAEGSFVAGEYTQIGFYSTLSMGPSKTNQANDYSYIGHLTADPGVAAAGSDNVTMYVNGTLVWGCPPQ